MRRPETALFSRPAGLLRFEVARNRTERALRFAFWTILLLLMTQGAFGQLTWTGADPSSYWSAPANWFPPGVPASGNDLVFPGGLPPADMVSTNNLANGIFRSITFDQGSRHTIRGNPMTLTNRSDCIINSGTNVIACDLTFSGTPPTPQFQYPTIRASFGSGELTVIGNVGGGSLYFIDEQWGTESRLVIRGQFTGGIVRVSYATLALYGDNPNAVSAEIRGSELLVQGSQPNLNITLFSDPFKTLTWGSLRGDGQIGDVTGYGYIVLDSTLSVRHASAYYLTIILNGTNAGEYGRLVASGNVSPSSGYVSASAGFNAQAGQILTVVEKTSPGPVTNAIFGPEGSITTLNERPFRLSYIGGDGNDVTLTAQRSDADPTFSDANWSPVGSGMGPYIYVYALAVSGNDVYAAGGFRTAGGSPATNIAKWDGTSWSALGSGINGLVYALAVSGSNLYAAGQFTAAGGSPAGNIARWDGSSWSVLGSGLGGAVHALAVSVTDLYAGGQFGTAGGSPAVRTAKWNGSNWSALGTGVANQFGQGGVRALAVSGNDLYAGGDFTTAGDSPANYIAKWNGSSWSALGSGMNHHVLALAVLRNQLYTGGFFTTAGNKAAAYIAKARIGSAAESITASGSSAAIQFSGVVGYQYHVQRTGSLTPPATWTTLTTTPLSPSDDGSFSFVDTNRPPGTAYYRLVQQ